MVTFLLLNAIFVMGTLLLAAAFRPQGIDRVLAASVLGFAIIILAQLVLSAFNAIRLTSLMMLCFVVLLTGLVLQFSRGGIRSIQSALLLKLPAHFSLTARALGALTLWAALHYLLQGLIWPVLPVSDAPIYHLPFAVQWWQSGAVELVPTPFGEEAATYFPANGELWLTWLLVTSSGGPVIKVGQWPFLALSACALYALGRQMGGTRSSSLVPASVWCVTPLALTQAAVANVDLIWTAYYLIGLYYLVRLVRTLRRGEPAFSEALLLGMSLGIVLGTKSVGLLFVPLLLAPAMWGCLRPLISGHEQGYQSRRTLAAWLRLGLLLMGLALLGSYWYLRNYRLTGNPVYPLHAAPFGFTLFQGWCSRASMLNTTYHIPLWRLDVLMGRFPVIAGIVPGLLWGGAMLDGVFRLRSRQGVAEWTAAGFAALAFINLMLFWVFIPYNTQERFLLPCLAIGLLPLAGLLRRKPTLMPFIVVAIVVHLFMIGPGTQGSMPVLPLARNALTLGNSKATAVMLLALLAASVLWRRHPQFSRVLAVLAVACGSYAYAHPAAHYLAARPHDAFYPRGGFADRMREAWIIVERARGRERSIVAYAGTNLPYYLYGSRLRNEVTYVAVGGHAQWLPHDYHRERIRSGGVPVADNPWPQWYRRELNYDVWLRNLRHANVQLLLVARENLHGRKRASNELPPFPIERQWADAHPECFEFLGPPEMTQEDMNWARVYRVHQSD